MKNGIHPDLFYDSAEANTRQSVLLVAACTGPRCAALRRLDSANPSHTAGAGDEHADHCGPAERSQSEVVLRAAIRQRRDAILVSVPCLGPCHQGSLTAVGRGVTGPGDQSLSWLGRPTLISRTDLPHRACALADWITGDAPDPDTFPEPLQTDEAPS